jgi:hypothetical protein
MRFDAGSITKALLLPVVFAPITAQSQVHIPAGTASSTASKPPTTWKAELLARTMGTPAPPPTETLCAYGVEAPDTLFLIRTKDALIYGDLAVWRGNFGSERGYWSPTTVLFASDTAAIKVVNAGCDPEFHVFADYEGLHLRLAKPAFIYQVDDDFLQSSPYGGQYSGFVFLRSAGALHRAALVREACDSCSLKIVDGDSLLARYEKAKAYKEGAPERARVAAIRATNYSAATKARLISGKAWIGMTAKQARLAWGDPDDINITVTAAGRHEQWVYGSSSYLYVDNGIVTGIQK